jgi:dihydroneopterin aldolase
MDKITLYNMKFFGYHGCEEFEQRNGQTFEVDAELFTSLEKAGRSDSLADAVNYVNIFERIRDVVETERHQLLERLAQQIADAVLAEPRITSVVVRVRKPAVPLPGMLDGVQVEIRRGRLV